MIPLVTEWMALFRSWWPERLTRRQRRRSCGCARSFIWLPIIYLEKEIVSVCHTVQPISGRNRSTHWSAGDGSGRDKSEKDSETHIGTRLLGDTLRLALSVFAFIREGRQFPFSQFLHVNLFTSYSAAESAVN